MYINALAAATVAAGLSQRRVDWRFALVVFNIQIGAPIHQQSGAGLGLQRLGRPGRPLWDPPTA